MSSDILNLINVIKEFSGQAVVKDVTLAVKKGEFLTLLGPSGCGKTTILRMIAGFETLSGGNILLEGISVKDKEPYERNVNTVFQNYALFPHLNVYDNIAYGLKVKKVPKFKITRRVREMLDLVQLTGFEKRRHDQLSGGQSQRVAIARALINNPRLLLLDEPLSALDFKLRKQMQLELKRLQKNLGITFIYVTHDQEEALNMSDRIAVLNQGKLEQVGTPEEIYERPRTRFVADFIGESNLFEAIVTDLTADQAHLNMVTGNAVITCQDLQLNDSVHISVRPEHLHYNTVPTIGFNIKGIIKEHSYAGPIIKTTVQLLNQQEVLINHVQKYSELPEPGTEVWLWWEQDAAVVVDCEKQSLISSCQEAIAP
jgi:spermidine/putrescine transport system ATP-binding protein